MTDIPRLETERLILRVPEIHDWPEYAELMLSLRAVYMGGPFTTAAAWGMFCNDVAQWQLFGHGSLIIDERETGRCLGQVGINHGPLFPEQELGWILYAHAEGKGYAFEAAQALRDWAFQKLRLKGLVSYIDPGNLRSQKLAMRIGAQLDVEAERQDPTDLVFRHPDP